jgi:outer membrane protein assembly factor BamD
MACAGDRPAANQCLNETFPENSMRQPSLALVTAGLCALVMSVATTSGCSGSAPKGERRVQANPLEKDQKRADRKLAKLTVEELYASAKEALDSGDPQEALKLYDDVQARFPFTRYATQSQLESVYAQYRAQQPELALAAANRFIKQHPQHPRSTTSTT